MIIDEDGRNFDSSVPVHLPTDACPKRRAPRFSGRTMDRAHSSSQALLDTVNTRYPTGQRNLALLLVMADAGLRVAEAVGLETQDLVTEAGQLTHLKIRHGKGGKQGRIALTPRAAAKLARGLQTREELGIGRVSIFCTISEGTASVCG